MNHGLSENEFNFLMSEVVQPLKKMSARVFLFGSRATGQFKKFSDVDLTYLQNEDQKIPNSEIVRIITAAENSRFSYKIDLVNYDELASSYKANIDREKIEL
ncbi:MAG: nucleotidyltransferase domain-containing protein [Bdellovibrio sp.]|nr:nucleotidyltransferase domain-containing protein [Bdellovibrio sp.]